MKDNKMLKKWISGVAVGSMVLTLGFSAFANEIEGTTTVDANKSVQRQGFRSSFINKGEQGKFQMKPHQNPEGISKIWADLVDDGTITQEIADKAITYFKAKDVERKAEFEKMKDMTKEEREALKNAKPEGRTNPMDELVAEGILTQKQVDTIKENQEAKMKAEREAQNSEKFSTLVKEGTIDQATADKVIAYLEEKSAERKAAFEKMKEMTKEERDALRKEGSTERQNPFNDLVTAGTLTQDQADAIAKTMFRGDNHGGPKGQTRK